jgi:hypothetical protein
MPPIHKKREISNTVGCVETAFYILKFYKLMLQLHFKFNLKNILQPIPLNCPFFTLSPWSISFKAVRYALYQVTFYPITK